jgi:hypothetical protein
VTASSGGLSPAVSSSFTVGAGLESQLVFLSDPSSFTAGDSSPSFQVAVEDSFGNVVTTSSDTVLLTPSPSAAFTGNSVMAVDGIATFPSLSTDVPGTYTVTASSGVLATAVSSPFTVTRLPAEAYTPLTPIRICDTRPDNYSDLSGDQAQCNGLDDVGERLVAYTPLTIHVAGEFTVPDDATAAVLNVTAIDASSLGYVTVYPAGQSAPNASNINFKAGVVVPNLTEIGLGSGGEVSLVSNVDVDLVVDLEGYVSPSTTGSGLYNPLSTPARICDTRPGNYSGLSGSATQCNGTDNAGKPLVADTPYDVQVDGDGGVPASGVLAVVLNVTVVDPAAQGFLAVYPEGEPTPTASNLNFLTPKQSVANRVIVPVSAGGAVSLYANQDTNAVVDVSGWFSSAGGSGTLYSPVGVPVRICDTRPGNYSGLTGGAAQCNGLDNAGMPRGPNSSLTVQVTGLAGIPGGAKAVVLNLTAIDPTEQTYLSVFPGLPQPLVSDLNPPPGTGSRRANLVVATLSAAGTVTIYNYVGTLNLVVDVSGWYS